MPYLWIFLSSYILVFVGVFYFLSQKMAQAANQMKATGVPQAQIDEYYRSMVIPTLVTLLWSTFFTGSMLGGVSALIYWLV